MFVFFAISTVRRLIINIIIIIIINFSSFFQIRKKSQKLQFLRANTTTATRESFFCEQINIRYIRSYGKKEDVEQNQKNWHKNILNNRF